MFSNLLKFLGGDPNKREVQRKSQIVEQINALVAPQLSEKTAFRTRLYQQTQADGSPGLRYAVVEIMLDDETAPLTNQMDYLRLIRKALHPHSGVFIRSYVHRDPFNDRRASPLSGDERFEKRRRDRRKQQRVLLEESFTYVDHGRILDQDVNLKTAHDQAESSASEMRVCAPDTVIPKP